MNFIVTQEILCDLLLRIRIYMLNCLLYSLYLLMPFALR